MPFEYTLELDARWDQRAVEASIQQVDQVIQDQARALAQFHGRLTEVAIRAVARRGQQIRP